MSRYDIIGAEELLTGNDMDGFSEVEDMLSGYDIIGAQRAGFFNRFAPTARYHPGMSVPPARGHYPAPGGYRGPSAAQVMQDAAAMKVANAGAVLRSQVPSRARRIVLPMTSTGTVAAGTSATITARPQTMAFKPQRVVIPATIAPNFTIEDIKVGNVSQLAQSGSLPGEAFVQTLFDGEMDMDTVQTSQDFVIQLTNISGAATTFRAAVYGRAAI